MPTRMLLLGLGIVAVVVAGVVAAQPVQKAGGVEVLEGTWQGTVMVRATNARVGVTTKIEKDGRFVSEPSGAGRWLSKGVFQGQDGKFTFEATTTNPDNRSAPVAESSGTATLEVSAGKETLTVISATTGNTATYQRGK